MAITEVFPNPTVKEVIFQIRFPNLFFIEDRIGDFQLKIMEKFPESSLLIKTQFLLADVGVEDKVVNVPEEMHKEVAKKIWQFKSDKDCKLNVLSNSLDISSQHHKTYNLEGGGDKFRDIIKYVLDNFFEVTAIPIINRIGLRYIDECPITSKNNESFKEYYNSVFPLDRFDLSDVNEMSFKTIVKKGEYNLCYIESLQIKDDKYKLILDFDGFAENISSDNCLNVTDSLHDIINEEYENTIKEPVYEYMKRRGEG